MIEIKTTNSSPKNASFVFNNDIKINEEERNLILFDIKENVDTIKESFGKLISGINLSKSVFYNERIAFDNESYFNSRSYIDTKLKYFKTLNEEKISNLIIGKFAKAFDDKCFKNLVHDLMIRSHYKKHKFDSEGLSLTALALAFSIFSNSIINLSKNEINNLLKVLSIRNDFLYGFTILTLCNNDALNGNLTKYFDNIYLVTKNKGISVTKVEKETLNLLNLKETNYAK